MSVTIMETRKMKHITKDGKKEGVETWWYEDGTKESEYHYKDGKEEGIRTTCGMRMET